MSSFTEHSYSYGAQVQGSTYQAYPYQGMSNSDFSNYPPHSQPVHTGYDPYRTAHQAYPGKTHQDFVLDTDSINHQLSVQPVQPISHLRSPAHSPTHSSANSFDTHAPVLSSTSDSGASIQSNMSSAIGSPSLDANYQREWNAMSNPVPSIVHHENFVNDTYSSSGFDYDSSMTSKHRGCVDPSLIQPTSPNLYQSAQFPDFQNLQCDQSFFFAPPSPAPSSISNPGSGRPSSMPLRNNRATSPAAWNPYPVQPIARRPSVSSTGSNRSQHSRVSQSSLDSSGEGKGICPIPTCGRHIKDLKAHLLTHKNERPEKCPIASCEYHIKGFARKYDKNRHTLTHYKGTMVCGFCPGSGSPSEKSFNRADVFKRHLTSVHGVEQTAPNSRRKSPGDSRSKSGYGTRETPGTCSTCGVVFANAQDFYEHLDDCVLRVVQQGSPTEAINEQLLTSMADDDAVQKTMERHMLSTALDLSAPMSFDQEDEDDDDEEGSELTRSKSAPGAPMKPCQHNSSDRNARQGMTHSKGGVALNKTGKGGKRRKNYPVSWGAAPEKMRMKKRVMCVFDGPRRLWKDDMMLDANHEVRVTLPGGDGRRWVTDLDVQTLRRAEGLHGATEEEKGPWLDENGHPVDFSLLVSQ
ncbi:hypothetical protein AAFC00_001318 [Neodothiora populina]|uniref:C2H2-type domain-containing protein n=1 Tax=Neodothiora populina TaxID=2781224 RepID=A0ABR3PPI4_9PEZI